jgi:hypothetical protein
MTTVSLLHLFKHFQSLIKASLAQLRSKLEHMKRDKEAVEAGIQGYEARCGDIPNYYDQ